MLGRRFHTVDVFAREPYAGNQLAVVHDAAALDDVVELSVNAGLYRIYHTVSS